MVIEKLQYQRFKAEFKTLQTLAAHLPQSIVLSNQELSLVMQRAERIYRGVRELYEALQGHDGYVAGNADGSVNLKVLDPFGDILEHLVTTSIQKLEELGQKAQNFLKVSGSPVLRT
ncbi:MAG: hypothetical protein SFT81_01310 [Candidatus Caenarcaniphilales bacterium]|nr:hypothetical protein [Candidatus Caenarcaniphilales bacterium]